MALFSVEKTVPKSIYSRIFSFIEWNHLRFIILDCPTDSSLPHIMEEFKQYHVTDVVRVCEPTYSGERLGKAGIRVHDLPFRDGGIPPQAIVQKFLKIVEHRFGPRNRPPQFNQATDEVSGEERPTIAVHCVAGLGRAPVLIAVALTEYGLPPLDSIELIRKKRRGAFNNLQIKFIDSYKRQKQKSARIASSSWGLATLNRVFRTRKAKEDRTLGPEPVGPPPPSTGNGTAAAVAVTAQQPPTPTAQASEMVEPAC